MKRIVTFIMAVIMIATLANPSTVDAATNAKLSKKKVTLTITEKKKNPSITLKVKGTSKKAAKKAKWTTSNKKVVKISKGKITARKPGKATITCKVGKKKLKCNVTVVDKRKAARTSEDETNKPGCEQGVHQWVKHWAIYETEGSYHIGESDWVSVCNCGVFFSEIESLSHRPQYKDEYDIQAQLGLHSPYARGEYTPTLSNTEVGIIHWTLRVTYPDYMDCTRCGMHVETTDLPKDQ